MKKMLCLILMGTLLLTSVAFSESTDDMTEFQSIMMASVSSQIESAADLTTTAGNRATLAALLSLEFINQQPDFKFNYSQPIYVSVQGDLASVAFAGEEDYVLVLYQADPLFTSYGYLKGAASSPNLVKAAMMAAGESIWSVPYYEYSVKLAAVAAQISGQIG